MGKLKDIFNFIMKPPCHTNFPKFILFSPNLSNISTKFCPNLLIYFKNWLEGLKYAIQILRLRNHDVVASRHSLPFCFYVCPSRPYFSCHKLSLLVSHFIKNKYWNLKKQQTGKENIEKASNFRSLAIMPQHCYFWHSSSKVIKMMIWLRSWVVASSEISLTLYSIFQLSKEVCDLK